MSTVNSLATSTRYVPEERPKVETIRTTMNCSLTLLAVALFLAADGDTIMQNFGSVGDEDS